MQVITPKTRTMPAGPFSMAVRHGDLIYVSGQVAFDGETGEPVEGGIEVQARQTLNNLKTVLEAAGSSLDKIIKLTCILPNFPQDYIGFNEVFQEFFPGPYYPARTTVQAGLLGGFVVEIEAIAVGED
jgi:2-iminobutanoate/2-iminopropanoate deaminase